MKKKILFVINTMGKAGAETALLALLRKIPKEQYDVSLFVLLGQGEMISEVPEHVHILNNTYNKHSVLSKEGRSCMYKTICKQMFGHGAVFKNGLYLAYHLVRMMMQRKLKMDKLLWYCLADGAQRITEHFDLAVSYLEGGAAYYVADHVSADKKAAFIHVDYNLAGYNRQLDRDCYLKFDQIFTVSKEVKDVFTKAYPELKERTDVFHNILNVERIKERSLVPGGFSDGFEGFRILTVGRLNAQKALEVSIEAMSLLKKENLNIRWYVLGDGDQKSFLKKQIQKFDVENEFILLGAVDNPFPYYAQTDLYVHASRFEGKSIAIQEAQILGCTVLVSDCSGNREQVIHGVDGELCDLNAESICQHIKELMNNPEKRRLYSKGAEKKFFSAGQDIEKMYRLMRDGENEA